MTSRVLSLVAMLGFVMIAPAALATPPTDEWTIPIGPSASAVGLWDVDGDHTMEIAVFTWSPDTTIVFYSARTHGPLWTFRPRQEDRGLVLTLYGFHDIDGDGVPECYVGYSLHYPDFGSYIVAVDPRTSDTLFELGEPDVRYDLTDVSDVDADGRLELVVDCRAQGGSEELRIYGYSPTGDLPARESHTATSLLVSPNPFRDHVTLRLSVPLTASATAKVYDLAGRLIRDLGSAAERGPRTIVWDGKDSNARRVPAAQYYIRIQDGTARLRQKVVVLPR